MAAFFLEDRTTINPNNHISNQAAAELFALATHLQAQQQHDYSLNPFLAIS